MRVSFECRSGHQRRCSSVLAYISHPAFFAHEAPKPHPECARRLSVIEDQLRAAGLYDLLRHHEAPAATKEQIMRVHSARLINQLEDLSPSSGFVAIDGDTFMNSRSLEAARHAAGAACLATDLVVEGRSETAFCAVRPPGHHAERDRAMGFCLFNNVAVGVAHALDAHGIERVAVLDFDVHHGNGTENIFAADERVLLCSTFQHPYYPLKGADTVSPHIVNIPLPAGTQGDAYRAAVSELWLPAIDDFKPQIFFVSAGFDAHAEDPLSDVLLVDDDYTWLTELIVTLAHRYARGRIVSCLEGGYALEALGRCVRTHIRGLAGL